MRLGLIGDIHAEDERLAALLDEFSRGSVDAILAVGDLVDGHGDLDRTASLLRTAGVVTVRGNHDRWLLEGAMRSVPDAHHAEALLPETRAFLESLPTQVVFETQQGRLLLCHAVGDDDMQTLKPFDEGYALTSNDALSRVLLEGHRFMVAGHTHLRMVRRFEQMTVLNPGTLYRHHEPGALLADLGEGIVQILTFDAALRVRVVEEAPIP